MLYCTMKRREKGWRMPVNLDKPLQRLGAFRHHYNHERPHSQLGYLTPLAFKAAWVETQAKLQDS